MIVVATEQHLDITADHSVAPLPNTPATNAATTLARLRQPVGLLALGAAEPTRSPFAVATHDSESEHRRPGSRHWRWTATDVPNPLEPPTIALHAGSPSGDAEATALEEIFAQENRRAAVTVSIDVHARPTVGDRTEASQAWVLRQIRRADIVTANERDLAHLYPGVPAAAIAAYWHDEGAACCAITSRLDGAMLLAPNGLAYRRTFPTGPIDDDATAGSFTAGLLAALTTIGALGDTPRARLAAVRPQQWLTVLEQADTVARCQPGASHPHRRHPRRMPQSGIRPPQPARQPSRS